MAEGLVIKINTTTRIIVMDGIKAYGVRG